jgi:hypothetical protein
MCHRLGRKSVRRVQPSRPVDERPANDDEQRAVAAEISAQYIFIRHVLGFHHAQFFEELDLGREEHATVPRIGERVLYAAGTLDRDRTEARALSSKRQAMVCRPMKNMRRSPAGVRLG